MSNCLGDKKWVIYHRPGHDQGSHPVTQTTLIIELIETFFIPILNNEVIH